MVVEDDDGYRCTVCGLHFTDDNDATACETFCQRHGACNSEIAARSVEASAT